MPKYVIQPGHTYRVDANTVKGPGDTIELADDVAALNPNSVQLLPDEAPDAAPTALPAELPQA
tara:strand:+ start:667 stop:855 length:189 start_codon:yes stop_codon:yes gene_type:complete